MSESSRSRRVRLPARRLSPAALALVAALVIGTVATMLVRGAADRRERAYLLSLAQTAVTTFDAEEIRGLAGSSEDLANPAYVLIKQDLESIRAANPDVRFAYLLAARTAEDEKLFFLADSEPVDSPDYSAPGDVYQGTTPEELVGYRQGRPFVEGPSRDSWGEWISAMAPIKDPATGETVALLGMDIGTGLFNARVRDAEVLPIALTLAMTLLLAIYWLFSDRSRHHVMELARERALSRVVLEDLPIGVVVAEYPSGEVVLQNPLAWSLAEGAGGKASIADYRFVTSEGSPYPPGEVPLARTLATGKKTIADDLFVVRPGANLRLRAISTIVVDEDGTPRYAVMVLEQDHD